MDRPWLAHYDAGVRASLAYPDLTLPAFFDATAGRYGDRVATVFHDAKLTYRRLKGRIDRFAAGLLDAGIRPGDRVAVMLPNLPQFLVAFFGTLRAGAIVVPTNPLYTAHELEHQLSDADAAAIVTLNHFFPRVEAALPNTDVRCVVVTDVVSALPARLQPFYGLRDRRAGGRRIAAGGVVHRFGAMLRAAPLSEPIPTGPDEVAVLQYTGGTTGTSKGAMLTHRNLIANALQALEWQHGVDEDIDHPTVLCAAPFFHVYGLTIGMNLAVAEGATMLLVPRFITDDVVHVAERYQPQFFPGVPTMYIALAEKSGVSPRQLGSIRVCISGAAPLDADVQHRFSGVTGARLVEGYGLTEASPVTHCNPVGTGGRVGTVGVPFPDTEAMITDPETWEPLPVGEVGEMTVRGPQVMRGYWRRPEETAEVLRGGWLHTGDMAVMDEDGFFRIVDRKKDVIIAGGYNIYPREVEEVLLAHPKVRDAAVIGVPNAYRGETVKAVIVLKEGMEVTTEELAGWCRDELAAFKVPRVIEFRDDLPRSLIGKVLRRSLREERTGEGIA
ncbi:MAG TPA: long-chain fatty acid--CoA ligase [Chloroflexota bacterium]|nr:long-chain fatty acid--CoA ligase [Chloroflexota bacterium]